MITYSDNLVVANSGGNISNNSQVTNLVTDNEDNRFLVSDADIYLQQRITYSNIYEKTPCAARLEDVSVDMLINDITFKKIGKFECDTCHARFHHASNMYRHKRTCKSEIDQNTDLVNMICQNSRLLTKQRNHIQELKSLITNIISTQQTSSVN